MTIRSILQGRSDRIISGHLEDQVRAAINILAEHRIGAIPVMDQNRVVGIFSERDLVRLLSAHGPEILDRSLGEVMTRTPVLAAIDMSIMGALALMTQKRVRHLPIMDDDLLCGFISIGDLVKYRIDKIEAEASALRDYIAT